MAKDRSWCDQKHAQLGTADLTHAELTHSCLAPTRYEARLTGLSPSVLFLLMPLSQLRLRWLLSVEVQDDY